MTPICFPQQNVVFTKPEGWTDDQCGQLSVHVAKADLGNGVVVQSNISCWEPSEEELQEIIRTRRVWISVISNGQPPISVMGITPFTES